MSEELHRDIGSLGAEVFHKPKWKTLLGRPGVSFMYGERVGIDWSSDEYQECELCRKTRNEVKHTKVIF